MSKLIKNVIVGNNITNVAIIESEKEDKCELCGKIAETRPYGKNGERICFKCAMKDKAETEKQMGIRLFGEKEDTKCKQ